MIRAVPITNDEQLRQAHEIRTEVFVHEQKVPAEAEIDEYEDVCRHYLALDESNVPVGTARWRTTSAGVKLERFAVLKEARGKGVGSALLKKILEEISSQNGAQKPLLYLHSQVSAMFLYEKFGFQPVGEMFEECGIQHYKMIREL